MKPVFVDTSALIVIGNKRDVFIVRQQATAFSGLILCVQRCIKTGFFRKNPVFQLTGSRLTEYYGRIEFIEKLQRENKEIFNYDEDEIEEIF